MKLHFVRELLEIVNTNAPFQPRNRVHVLLETVSSKKLVLLFLEIFAESVIFMLGNEFSKRRKQNRVFSCFVRLVHTEKLMKRLAEIAPVVGALQGSRSREMQGHIGEDTTLLMLIIAVFFVFPGTRVLRAGQCRNKQAARCRCRQ